MGDSVDSSGRGVEASVGAVAGKKRNQRKSDDKVQLPRNGRSKTC